MRGRKPLLIFLIVPLLFLFYNCGGGGSGSSFDPPADTPGLPFSLTILPSQSIAQTNSSIIINAKVLDGNGVPAPNVTVTFTNLSEPFGVLRGALKALGIVKPIGELSSTLVNTNNLGIASVSIFSSVSGFATVQADISNSVGVSSAKKTFFFATSLDLAPTLQLTADNPVLFESPNDNQSNIIATVRDKFGLLAFGRTVTFGADFAFRVGADPTTTCSDGTKTCSVTFPNGNTGTTNSSGQTSTLVRVDPTSLRNIDTVLNITATADNGAFNLTSLLLKPVTISGANSTLSASPEVVQVTKTSTITAGVVLNTGAPTFDNTAVNFVTTCGTIDPFGLTTSGKATATFTAPAAVPASGICTVSASAAGVPIGPPSPTGTQLDIKVITGFTVLPATQTVSSVAGGDPIFTIFGGVPPYTIISNNVLFPPDPTTRDASGDTFTTHVNVGVAAATVTYTVTDQTGATATTTLTITAVPTIKVTPASATLTCPNTTLGTTATTTFFITGGATPYSLTSLNSGVAVTTPVNTQGGSFTATADCSKFLGGSTAVSIVLEDSASPVPTITTVPVTVVVPLDFSISCTPAAVNSTTTTSTCTLTALNGISNPVTLTCSPAAPTSGGSCAFSVSPITPIIGGATSVLTYTCGVAGGPAAFNVHGSDGTLSHDFAMTATCP